MSATSERIKSLIESTGLSRREIARRIGVSHVSLSQWISGKNEPSREKLESFCEFFSVTPAYVLYGTGNAPEQTIAHDDGTVAIPLLDIRCSCGGGCDVPADVSLIRFLRASAEFIRRYCPSANVRSLQIVTASGDSMAPTFQDGDAVIVDRSETRISADGIYAIRVNGSVFIKRVQTLPSGVRLLSDNHLYPPIDAHAGEIDVIGRCYVGVCLKSL